MQELGRYQLLEPIGQGGMGAVYRAYDPLAQREVAVKVLLAGEFASPAARRRFSSEAAALSKVAHPHVVRLLDHGVQAEGTPFLVMELLRGSSLEQRLRRSGPLSVHDALATLRTVCSAVGACHAVGVLHRDLKPDNVFVAEGGSLKLVDFGLARDTDADLSRSRLSVGGQLIGTPGYWAPEQAQGELERIDVRTDVYGLGALLHALLCGRPPAMGETLDELLRLSRTVKPPVSTWNPEVPRWLDRVVARALAPEPSARFPSAEALAAALTPPRAASRATRRVALALVAAGALTAGLLLANRATSRTRLTEAEQRYRHGVALGEQGDDEGALQAFSAAIALDPHDLQALVSRAAVLRRLGRWDEAVADYDRAIALAPDQPRLHERRGGVRSLAGDLQGAIDDASIAIRRDPDNASAYVVRALARIDLRAFDEALADLDRAVVLAPDYATAWGARADLRRTQGQPGARQDYDMALRLDPDYLAAYLGRAAVRQSAGDLVGSEEDLTQALRLDPECAEAYYNRGVLHGLREDSRAAIADYSRALQLQPDYVNAWFNRALRRLALEDFTGAIDDLNELLALDPHDTEALGYRSSIHYKAGDVEAAIADAERVLQLDPDDTRAQTCLPIYRQRLAAQSGTPR